MELALALLPRFNGHMGDTIIALGMLSAVDLFRLIGEQIRARFTDLISWGQGQYEFYRGVACRADILEMQFDVFTQVAKCLIENSETIPVEETLSAMAKCTVTGDSQLRALIRNFDLAYEIETILRQPFESATLGTLVSSTSSAKERKDLVRAMYFAVEAGLWKIKGRVPTWRGGETGQS